MKLLEFILNREMSEIMAAQVSTCNLEFMRAYALSQCEQLRYFETGGQAGASNNYSPPEVNRRYRSRDLLPVCASSDERVACLRTGSVSTSHILCTARCLLRRQQRTDGALMRRPGLSTGVQAVTNSSGGGEGTSGSPPPVARQCNYYDANLLQDTRLPTTGGAGGET